MMFSPNPDSEVYEIILVRHGESVGNAEGRHQGQQDFPLSETGKAQARALAERFQQEGRHFDLILTSPLRRAFQTAGFLAKALDTPMETAALWMERDAGLLSGLRPEEASKIAPRPDFFHPYRPIGETGESQWALYIRASQAILDLFTLPAGKYCVVSHGGILNMALYAILGIPVQANFSGARFQFQNTSFTELSYRPESHQWTVLGFNDRGHWRSDQA
jgi:broad specificity phosphatase PhoE